MPTSPYPRTGVVLPLGSETDQVPADLKRAFDQGEVVNAVFVQSSYATRPTVGVQGRFHEAIDTGVLSYDTGTAWVEYGKRPPLVGALPSSPYDAQEVVAKPDPAGTGAVPATRWHLQYDASLAAPYRWAFRAGTPTARYAPRATPISGGSGTYAGFGFGSGGTLTVPFSGIYVVDAGAHVYSTTGGAGNAVMQRSDESPTDSRTVASGNNDVGFTSFAPEYYPAGTAIQFAHRVISGTDVRTQDYWARLTPVALTS